MSNEEMLVEVEKCRAAIHSVVDARFDLIVRSIQSGDPLTSRPKRGVTLLLSTAPYQFKGTKPAAVIFPDGRRVEVTKWRTAATTILQDCFNTPGLGERLMDMRGKVLGRKRTILAASAKGMDVPLEIGPELYMEGKFDTESLLYVLTERVLKPAGYRYQEISIQLRQ